MNVINNGPLGDSLLSYHSYTNTGGKGLQIVQPTDGYCVIQSSADGIFRPLSFYSNGVIASRKGLFGKSDKNEYTVYSISRHSTTIKGYAQIMGYDADADRISTEYNISYDINLQVSPQRLENFIEFVLSEKIFSPVSSDVLKQKIEPSIVAVLQNVVGKYLLYRSATFAQCDALEIAADVKAQLNDTTNKFYDIGLAVNDVVLNVGEDFEHRETKKRWEQDRLIRTIGRND